MGLITVCGGQHAENVLAFEFGDGVQLDVAKTGACDFAIAPVRLSRPLAVAFGGKWNIEDVPFRQQVFAVNNIFQIALVAGAGIVL